MSTFYCIQKDVDVSKCCRKKYIIFIFYTYNKIYVKKNTDIIKNQSFIYRIPGLESGM